MKGVWSRMRGWRLPAVAGLVLSLVGCSGGPVTGKPLVPEDDAKTCQKTPFDHEQVKATVLPNVVRLVADGASGTGWVLNTNHTDQLLIVTNRHVIAEGDKFSAIFQGGTNETKTEVAGLEVVKVDAKNDLAILRASRLGGMVDGLGINPLGPSLGQKVAAMGYPYVQGSEFQLTFEQGDITLLEREMEVGGFLASSGEKRKFVQTSVNINPGNSGGPVVDACGTVVGVVVAKSTTTERVGLVVPVKHMVDLYSSYDKPKVDAETGIKELIEGLGRAIRRGKKEAVESLFSRAFLNGVVSQNLGQFLKMALMKEDVWRQIIAEGGYDYDQLSDLEKYNFLKERLQDKELLAWVIFTLNKRGEMGKYEALTFYLEELFVSEIFPNMKDMKILEIEKSGDKSGLVGLEVTDNDGNTTSWDLKVTYEWGDWRVADAECKRGACPRH